MNATAELQALEPPLPTRVLILTTYNLDEYVFAALRAGADGFLLKHAPTRCSRTYVPSPLGRD